MSSTPSSTSSLDFTPSSPLSPSTPTSTNSPDSQPTHAVKSLHLVPSPQTPHMAAQQQNSRLHSALSTMPTQTTILLIIPMPVLGTANAPLFEGKDTERYLKKIVQHGVRAGITDKDSLVDYILDYCSVEVYEFLRYVREFDPEVLNRTWHKASDRLIRLYPAKHVSVNDLRRYCLSRHPFNTEDDVDKYQLGFLKISNTLVKSGRITKTYANKLFMEGLPRHLASWIRTRVPEANRTDTNPPTIDTVVDLLYERLCKDFIA
ncbi:hypothetical protein BDP27DRAFT_1498178 [Rhodocollybia butyracea]|uniref:Uncharacterized protein n=1 Tax=Rhodocollybia butyracea TaxID=206335 RepID=A0A9P5PAC8_9AGAR|nr:hypothetical protein BDP27DRAFT_1498178 [Rhodocollybia butyracea]